MCYSLGIDDRFFISVYYYHFDFPTRFLGMDILLHRYLMIAYFLHFTHRSRFHMTLPVDVTVNLKITTSTIFDLTMLNNVSTTSLCIEWRRKEYISAERDSILSLWHCVIQQYLLLLISVLYHI